MPDTSILSETQKSIYDLLNTGKNPNQIATKLGTTEALVRANMTRMTTKGFTLPGGNTVAANAPSSVPAQPKPQPKPRTEFTHEEIRKVVSELDGKAVSADQLKDLASNIAGGTATEIHPMILLGVTIQYMKLCGGRMQAHQVIEDVYAGMRLFSGYGVDAGGETVPPTVAKQ